jgi:hypothetical protein
MYIVIQRYTFDPQISAALALAMKAGLVPLLQKIPDFVAYYWLDNDNGAGAALCMFEEQASAERSLELATAFVQQHATARADPPEIIRGEVKIHAVCTL